MHYTAALCEERIGRHLETHKGLARFLDENNLQEVATLFRQLETLRISRWYGAKGNGETVKLAYAILEKIKEMLK